MLMKMRQCMVLIMNKKEKHTQLVFTRDGGMETWILDWLKENAEGFDELLATPDS